MLLGARLVHLEASRLLASPTRILHIIFPGYLLAYKSVTAKFGLAVLRRNGTVPVVGSSILTPTAIRSHTSLLIA